MKKLFLFSLFLFLIFSCNNKNNQKDKKQSVPSIKQMELNFNTILKYAKGFKVNNYPKYKEIHVFNPIGNDTLATYITALDTLELADSIKKKGILIPVPAKSIACLSTTNIGSIEILNLYDKLIGVTSPEYIWDKKIQQLIADSKIKEIGRGMGVNIERIIELSPELLIQSYIDRTDVDGKLSKTGVKILYDNSWKETSLLARAEWMKFMAIFFCKERIADSVFNSIVNNYEKIKEKAKTDSKKPFVMYGYDYKGIWYIPQDDTYIARAIRDANAIFKGAGKGNSSIPKSFEEVYDIFHNAEYWLTTRAKVQNMKEFISYNDRYIHFDAAKNNKVYTNNKREKPIGGNDYWESGINRPDLLLKDIVKITHPKLYPEYEITYWRHLK